LRQHHRILAPILLLLLAIAPLAPGATAQTRLEIAADHDLSRALSAAEGWQQESRNSWVLEHPSGGAERAFHGREGMQEAVISLRDLIERLRVEYELNPSSETRASLLHYTDLLDKVETRLSIPEAALPAPTKFCQRTFNFGMTIGPGPNCGTHVNSVAEYFTTCPEKCYVSTSGHSWAGCGPNGQISCGHNCNDYGHNVSCTANVEIARPDGCFSQGGYSIYCPELNELMFSDFVFVIYGCGSPSALCDC
jgi:hypothetical protein